MRLSEGGQDLLERLWVATEEEEKGGLDAAGLPPEDVTELVEHALAERCDGELVPTAEGREEGAQAIRRHRLAERLLADVLMAEEGMLDEQACRLEHALFDGIDSSICTLLGHPRFCPHGKPIPPGECCDQMQRSVERLIAPLSEMEEGRKGSIAYVRMGDPRQGEKLMAMGILPGVPVTLLQRFPSFVFEAGYSQFAVDEETASAIHVRLAPRPPEEDKPQGFGRRLAAAGWRRGWGRKRCRKG